MQYRITITDHSQADPDEKLSPKHCIFNFISRFRYLALESVTFSVYYN